ncbi:MAG: methionyl-tRNA formyltransferase, partial [Polyangiaceae bacterium]|nr:methionyl-tRNA formyltransferase [Polyangiaceae bacterium]
MRAIFFGSPEFAVPCLDALVELADVVAVVCQPDRPAGRGLALTPPAVKVRALALGLEILQPTKVRVPEFAESLRALDADVGVVVAYGRILPRAVLDAPRTGCVNVHASILPRFRGAAPIQWAIAEGDRETGVTLMQVDEGMDTGAMLSVVRTPIDPNETAQVLAGRLSTMGANLLRTDLARYVAGELPATPQDDAQATMAPLLTKEDGRLDFAWPAQRVHDRVRGMSPWPGAFTTLDGKPVKVHRTHVAEARVVASPGEVVASDEGVIRVACGDGSAIDLLELQDAGKKRVPAAQ